MLFPLVTKGIHEAENLSMLFIKICVEIGFVTN